MRGFFFRLLIFRNHFPVDGNDVLGLLHGRPIDASAHACISHGLIRNEGDDHSGWDRRTDDLGLILFRYFKPADANAIDIENRLSGFVIQRIEPSLAFTEEAGISGVPKFRCEGGVIDYSVEEDGVGKAFCPAFWSSLINQPYCVFKAFITVVFWVEVALGSCNRSSVTSTRSFSVRVVERFLSLMA